MRRSATDRPRDGPATAETVILILPSGAVLPMRSDTVSGSLPPPAPPTGCEAQARAPTRAGGARQTPYLPVTPDAGSSQTRTLAEFPRRSVSAGTRSISSFGAAATGAATLVSISATPPALVAIARHAIVAPIIRDVSRSDPRGSRWSTCFVRVSTNSYVTDGEPSQWLEVQRSVIPAASGAPASRSTNVSRLARGAGGGRSLPRMNSRISGATTFV